MARTLLLHQTGAPWIDYGQFILFDVESRRYSPLDLPQQRGDEIGVSGDGGARFFTLGDFTDVGIDFELWSAEPGSPERPFQRQFDGQFTVDTGRVVVGCVTGSPADMTIRLPVPGPFRLRAFRNSHAGRDPEALDMSRHEERWLLQAWPADTVS